MGREDRAGCRLPPHFLLAECWTCLFSRRSARCTFLFMHLWLKVRRRFANTSAEESAAAVTADWPKLFLHPKTQTLNCRWDAGWQRRLLWSPRLCWRALCSLSPADRHHGFGCKKAKTLGLWCLKRAIDLLLAAAALLTTCFYSSVHMLKMTEGH